MEDRRYRILDSPTGPFYLATDDDGRIRTGWLAMFASTNAGPRSRADLGIEDPDLLPELCHRLLDAMIGGPSTFDDVEIHPGTPFQRSIWRATRRIAPGSVRTYGELALAVGRPGAARAVGQAMRRNPQPIITPCHRVVSSADIGGFGGQSGRGTGLAIKDQLLGAEGVANVHSALVLRQTRG